MYINGATAEFPPNTSNAPIMIRKSIMGINHHFFRCLINRHRSFKNSIVMGFGEEREGWGLGRNRDWGLGIGEFRGWGFSHLKPVKDWLTFFKNQRVRRLPFLFLPIYLFHSFIPFPPSIQHPLLIYVLLFLLIIFFINIICIKLLL